MIALDRLARRKTPFKHWVADGFIDAATVGEINVAWPGEDHAAWRVEAGARARKASILFPERLPSPAQALATELAGSQALEHLSGLLGIRLLPDPWLLEGAGVPRLGGGLHEIGPGGLLKVHVDFERHPSGLRRVANLLIYFNEDWLPEWGGALELCGAVRTTILPLAGRAVLFQTTPDSWHGHPDPLACPPGRARRSMALYYYAADAGPGKRASTVYRRDAQ